MHIPILGADAEQNAEDSTYKPDLLNPLGVYVSKEATNENMMSSEVESCEQALFEDTFLLDERLLEEATIDDESSTTHNSLGNEPVNVGIPSPLVELSSEC